MDAAARSFTQSQAYLAEAGTIIAGGVNSNVRLVGTPVPLCFERGEGAYLYDIDGNRFIDYMLGMGPTILGHAPKPVIDAVAASLMQGQMLGGQNRSELELARLLNGMIPNAEMVRISMTGSEVVQAALRVSRAATGRQKFIKFEGQYHGWYDNVLLNHAPAVLAAGDNGAIPREPHFETKGQSPTAAGDVIVLPWNDLGAVRAILEQQGHEIAALITEPMMCNTGTILPKPGYLEGLRELTAKHGIVLIFDEVITGFRLALGGAQERFGVTPDLATYAKAMAGGFPIAALTGKRELMSLFGTGAVNHSGTYNAALPLVAASIATLGLLSADNGAALKRIHATGEALMEGLRQAGRDAGLPLQVNGVGAVFNTSFGEAEITDYQSYKRSDLKLQQRLLAGLVQQGVRAIPRGTWFVSAAHNADDVATTLDAARHVLRQLADG
jgi:glutamate-1-semialdehyde 2,1-aminomutase